jgi:DNA polymerase I
MIPITNAYVRGEEIILIGRHEGHLVRNTIAAERSLFLRLADIPADVDKALRDHHSVKSVKVKDNWVRVVLKDHNARKGWVEWLRTKNVPTFEGDVGPVRRYFAESGAQVARPRRAYIDFEADSRRGFDFGKMRLVSWSVVYEDGTSKVQALLSDTDDSEKVLIEAFYTAIDGADQIVAWNGERFDFPFLEARCERYSLHVDHRRWLWMDMMLAYKRLATQGADGDEKESAGLDAVSQVILGEGKTEIPAFIVEKFGKHRSLGSLSYDLWAAGGAYRQLLIDYNLKDADLMRRIEMKIGVLAMHDAICQACQVLPDSRGLLPTQHVEGFMLRLGAQRGVHFKTRPPIDEKAEAEAQFRGAYVLEPKRVGRVENVHVADFSSMYPSIIISWNLSPETKDMSVPVEGVIPAGCCRTPETRIGFRTDVVGLLPLALIEMLKLRKEWSDKKASLTPGTEEWVDAGRRSDGYKIAANSFYGVAGNKYSRFYDRDVAEATSTTGAWLIKQVMKEAEVRGYEPLYADTDSNFIGGVTRTEFQAFCDFLNNEAFPRWTRECGCRENRLKIAYEKAFEAIIFISKKRYAAKYAHYKGKEASADSKPEVRGLEYRRGDTGRLARSLQKEVVYKLLGIGCEAILDPVYYSALVQKWQTHILDDTLPIEEICFSKSLSKPLDGYLAKIRKDGTDSTLPGHVQVGKQLAARGRDIYDGSRITYFVLDGSKQPIQYRPVEDFDGNYDRCYLWEHAVSQPSIRVLEAVFAGRNWASLGKARPPRSDHVLPGQTRFKFGV